MLASGFAKLQDTLHESFLFILDLIISLKAGIITSVLQMSVLGSKHFNDLPKVIDLEAAELELNPMSLSGT
jgi:hypothetical protein